MFYGVPYLHLLFLLNTNYILYSGITIQSTVLQNVCLEEIKSLTSITGF